MTRLEKITNIVVNWAIQPFIPAMVLILFYTEALKDKKELRDIFIRGKENILKQWGKDVMEKLRE